MRALLLLSISFVVILTSCAGSLKYPKVDSLKNLALVGYSLDHSIVMEDSKETIGGPGLLQDRAEYYKHHMIAVEQGYAEFVQTMPEAFGATFIDQQAVTANPYYIETFKESETTVLGITSKSNENTMLPIGTNLINIYDKAPLNKLAEELGVDGLIVVSNKAEFSPTASFLGAGKAGMRIKSTVSLYVPGKGITWIRTYRLISEETVGFALNHVSDEDIPVLYADAHKKLAGEIKATIERGKAKEAELAGK